MAFDRNRKSVPDLETKKHAAITLKTADPKHLTTLSNWLFICCGAVFCMIIIGAITRLSGSGLSMVEWRPMMGALPPLNDAEWQRVFELYKKTPEFIQVNSWMAVDDFKYIFFWEWFHRLFGRLIGVLYALPFFYFLVRGWIPGLYKAKLFGLLVLGGLQGVMGWYMVKSGLIDEPAVSHYRLAAHLSLAFLIYALMFWLALTFKKTARSVLSNQSKPLFIHALVVLFILTATIFWGAFVAGLDAGLVYNDTYPKMGKTWIPEEVWFYDPVWMNFIENHAGVQFTHRWLAKLTIVAVFSLTAHALIKQRKEFIFPLLSLLACAQLGLGIATLFSHVELTLAVLHQAGAVILLSALISAIHATKFKNEKKLDNNAKLSPA